MRPVIQASPRARAMPRRVSAASGSKAKRMRTVGDATSDQAVPLGPCGRGFASVAGSAERSPVGHVEAGPSVLSLDHVISEQPDTRGAACLASPPCAAPHFKAPRPVLCGLELWVCSLGGGPHGAAVGGAD